MQIGGVGRHLQINFGAIWSKVPKYLFQKVLALVNM
jgi:hypothetical protein